MVASASDDSDLDFWIIKLKLADGDLEMVHLCWALRSPRLRGGRMAVAFDNKKDFGCRIRRGAQRSFVGAICEQPLSLRPLCGRR